MSRRAIRKLEQEKSASAVPEHSEESEGEAEVYDAGATLNPFGALEIAEVEVLGSGWHEANSGIAEGVASDVQQRQLGGDHEEGHREKETAAQEVLSSDERQGIINDSERSKKASTKRRAKRSRQKKKKDVTQSPRDVSEKAVPGSSNMKIDALEESPSADLVAGDPQRLMFVDVKRLHPDRERRSLLRMRIYSADSESRTRPRNPSRAVPRFRRSIFSPPIEGFPDQAPGARFKMRGTCI